MALQKCIISMLHTLFQDKAKEEVYNKERASHSLTKIHSEVKYDIFKKLCPKSKLIFRNIKTMKYWNQALLRKCKKWNC